MKILISKRVLSKTKPNTKASLSSTQYKYKPKQVFGNIQFDDINGSGVTTNHRDILYLGAVLYMSPKALLSITGYKNLDDVSITPPVASPAITVNGSYKVVEYGNIDVGVYAHKQNIKTIPVHVTFTKNRKARDIDESVLDGLFSMHKGIKGIYVDGKGYIGRGDIDAY